LHQLAELRKPLLISGASIQPAFGYDRVRTDSLITVSFLDGNSDGNDTIVFVTRTPGGAQNPPVCATPVTVATIANLVNPCLNVSTPFGEHQSVARKPSPTCRSHRLGAASTTFLLNDDCKNPELHGKSWKGAPLRDTLDKQRQR
jgi:hypothetical protein